MFIGKNEVEPALKTVREIFNRLDRKQFYERMASIIFSYSPEEDIESILTALPIALQTAKEKQCGLLAISWSPYGR